MIPRILEQAIDAIRAHDPVRHVWMLGGAIVVTALVGGALRFGMREWLNGLSRWVEYDLRNDLFAHLEALDASYYTRTRTGDIMARLTNDLGAVRMTAGPAIMYLTNTVFGGMFALYFMSRINVRLTLLAFCPMILLPIISVRLAKLIHMRFESVQEHFSSLTTHAQENLTGVRIVRAYRQEDAEIAHFGALNQEYLSRNMALVRLWGVMQPLFSTLAGAGAIIVLGVGGMLALRGTITIGAFVAFGMYLTMLTWPLIALGWVINLFQRGDASMRRLLQILDERPRILTELPEIHLPATSGGRTIEFRDVGFHFPTSGDDPPRWVLQNVSFVIPAGATAGIVGATGSGKSALIDLIARVYDPQRGEVLIDGVPVKRIPLDELRREIGYVPQESLLFSDTISANLAYGLRPGDDPDAWRAAAVVAQLEETISAFPDSYETVLGERGINLSGGQKQRAALARALARKPAIVLLDDALSAVDTHTEAEILRGLRSALSTRTAVIASHRASALRDAAMILVLDDGGIVERGTHSELLAAEGRYWALLRRQQLVEEVTAGV
ncbi:MAG: ABC transporter ATP-binding protein/permease [Gemmatimonadota bacterium]|nr:ABC transporter ATP-binding protein/permease [Gemmatimonadota bacterium]